MLEEVALDGVIREKQLQFFVNLVGPFYSVAEDWIKEGYVEEESGGWTMYPPMETDQLTD